MRREGGMEGEEGRREEGRDGGTKRGKEVRREGGGGTRTKPGNQLVYYICIHLLDPHWTMPRQAVICKLSHSLLVKQTKL